MTAYINSPFQDAVTLIRGKATYLFGGLNDHQANTKMFISNVALTTNAATITGTIVAGEIPKVGSLISIIQTQTATGAFNVNRVPITAVSITGTTGHGTISFALTHADVTSAADTGTAIIEVPETSDSLAAGASIACCLPSVPGVGQDTVPLSVTFAGGVLPTAVTVHLQAAMRNVDSEFTNVNTNGEVVVATGAYTSGPFAQVTLQRGYFYRLNVSGLTAGSATGIIGKIGG